ncbi:MAG TPA: HRDC domain-containing protein [Solirubrobacteraceae bacterium]|nr:HRDC domain-containing protein [Solirubrobacteraceae bacterium]
MSPDQQAALAEIAELARNAGTLAFDTEFMGEGRYRTLLCLIQLAAPERAAAATSPSAGDSSASVRAAPDRIEVIDPFEQELDGAPLAQVLADERIELVVHAGRQDVALVRRRFRTDVRNLFDTQIAAGFAGLPAQSSYDSLLSEILGVRLAKSASFTRWDARPLSDEQLEYARGDVVHLLELAAELQRRLRELGRLEWARQECAQLERSSDERDLDVVFARLPRIRGLNAASQAIARELVQWRESTAERQDRPVQSVLGDAALVELAKRKPANVKRLEEIRGLGQGVVRRSGAALLEALERGAQRPHEPLENGLRPPPPDATDAPLIALSEALVRARAREADLAYELVASRADLQAIVAAQRVGEQADVRTLRGWRRELVGDELLELLDGRVSLSVDGRRLRVQGSSGA